MTFSVGNSRFRRTSNLDKVIYILEKLGQDSSSASPEKMARELYVEEDVIRSFIKFLKDMQWIKEKDWSGPRSLRTVFPLFDGWF
jgi:hypothetical protein